MRLADETVMAYVDEELDAAARAEVEAAMTADAEVRLQVQAQLDLRSRLRATFDPVLAEPVPERLMQAARQSPADESANVVDLPDARAAKQERLQARRRWSMPQFGALAASLAIGLLIGRLSLDSSPQGDFSNSDGRLFASGGLDEALTRQLASHQPESAPVRIGLTYRNDSGVFCRTFVLARGAAFAGIACRSDDAWRVDTLTQIEAPDAGAYRMAGSELPEPVRRTVEATISGEPLDMEAERAAQGAGWRINSSLDRR